MDPEPSTEIIETHSAEDESSKGSKPLADSTTDAVEPETEAISEAKLEEEAAPVESSEDPAPQAEEPIPSSEKSEKAIIEQPLSSEESSPDAPSEVEAASSEPEPIVEAPALVEAVESGDSTSDAQKPLEKETPKDVSATPVPEEPIEEASGPDDIKEEEVAPAESIAEPEPVVRFYI